MTKIIGYHITDKVTANSENRVNNGTTDQQLAMLFEPFDDCIKVMYHMDYSVACLLKRLQYKPEQLAALIETNDLVYQPLKIEYIPGVWFAIKNTETGEWAGFSDMQQYITRSLLTNLKNAQTPEAALRLATTAWSKGQDIYKALAKLGLQPTSLTSPISVFNKGILSHISLPTIDDMPAEAAQFAYNCTHGGWVEAFKLGYFKEAYDYDIRSAYGSQLAQLIDTRFGTWIQDNKYRNDAIYGYCLCHVDITKNFSPIIVNGYTPVGSFTTYLTKEEMYHIVKHDLGNFEIIDGWWWIPSVSKESLDIECRPLRMLVHDLFTIKEETEDEVLAGLLKRILAGIWGKTLETTAKGFGYNFNPCWGAEVESRIRLQVADTIQTCCAANSLVSITVDGMITDQPLNLLLCDRTMGSWKANSPCPVVVVGSGIQCLENRHQQGNFSLNYDWLVDSIKHKPKAQQHKITGCSAMTAPKAYIHKKWGRLGCIDNIDRVIGIGQENKRCYVNEPVTGKDLLENQYSSVAWDYSLVKEAI